MGQTFAAKNKPALIKNKNKKQKKHACNAVQFKFTLLLVGKLEK